MRRNPAFGVADLPEGVVVTFSIEEDDFVTVAVEEPGEEAWVGNAELEFNDDCDAWEVMAIEAADGWGPFVYEVLMEWATVQRSSLVPSRDIISKEAKAVWKRFKTRTDVKREKLPSNCQVHGDLYLNYAYTKPSKTLRSLGELGLIEGS
jgi:hypothetical protein